MHNLVVTHPVVVRHCWLHRASDHCDLDGWQKVEDPMLQRVQINAFRDAHVEVLRAQVVHQFLVV